MLEAINHKISTLNLLLGNSLEALSDCSNAAEFAQLRQTILQTKQSLDYFKSARHDHFAPKGPLH